MRASISLACGLTTLLCGCSLVLDTGRHMGGTGGDSGTDSSPPSDGAVGDATSDAMPLLPGNVCPQLARVLCEGRRNCCSMTTPEGCQDTLRDSCFEFVGPIVLEPNVRYDPLRGGELLAMAEESAIACDSRILNLFADRDGLLSMFRGMFGPGEECVTSDPMLPLLLRPIARIFTCMQGNMCVDDGVMFTCQPLLELESECMINFECGDDLYCAQVTPSVSQCSPREPNRTACTGPVQCASLYCDDTSSQCEAPTPDEVWCPDPFGLLLPNPPGMR